MVALSTTLSGKWYYSVIKMTSPWQSMMLQCYSGHISLLEISCKICQDNLIRVFLQDLERFLQESYKNYLSKILQDLLECSCKILARIFQDI